MNERIKAGSDIHAGDGGYGIGTKENYDAFVKVRNKSLAAARIRELAEQCTSYNDSDGWIFDKAKFAKLIVEDVLDKVRERAYYTGDRDWSDELDRPWIQLEFGYGPLYDV